MGRPADAPRREVRFAPIDGLIYSMPVAGFSGADHALASLRESNLTLAIMSHASALTIVASKSFARRRLRLSQAMVRSTTQRRGNNLKPLAASDRLTISMVQRPIEASAFLSFGPA